VLQVKLEMAAAGLKYMPTAEVEDSRIYWCKYWGKPLKSMPKSNVLSNQRWNKLYSVVASMATDLCDLPASKALMLIRTQIGCNLEIMSNLNSSARVWDPDPEEKLLSSE
jgi:hypothetical protein